MTSQRGYAYTIIIGIIFLITVLMLTAALVVQENGSNTGPTNQTQVCDLSLEYSHTAVAPVACTCPAGYEFEVTSRGWGPCPEKGMSDCPATMLKCVPTESDVTTVDLAPFRQIAENSTCNDKRNALFVIDDALVAWSRSGSCPDASYFFGLYDGDTDHVLCRAYDSIDGQQITCDDETYRSMFMTMFQNLDAADLGLGSEYTVIATPVSSTTATSPDGGFLYLDPPTHQNQSSYAALKKMSSDGQTSEIATLLMRSTNNRAAYHDGKVYYITKEPGDSTYHSVGVYTISSGASSILFSGEDNTESSIRNIYLVAPDRLYYLQGPCQSSGQGAEYAQYRQCDLYKYTISAGTQELLIHNIYDQLEFIYLAALRFTSFDPDSNIMHMAFAGGDAGFGAMATYDIYLGTKTVTKTGQETFAECGEPCPADQAASNERYEQLLDSARQVPACGDFTFTPASYYDVYRSGELVDDVTPTTILTCFE